MSRPTYDVKETYTGTGLLSTYTFDFKIESSSQLLVIEVNALGVETQRVRGNNLTYLSGITINPISGGSVTLAAPLATGYRLILLLANDAPVQSFEFSNKTTFSLKRIENALDVLAGAIQRLVYRGKQSIRIHDLDNEETFNAQLPPGIATQATRTIRVNSAGTGFEFGQSSSEAAAGSIPTGGGTGAVLVKNSPTDNDAGWDDLVIEGYSQRFNTNWSSVGLRDFIEQLLDIIYLGPVISSFTGSSNVLREKGDTVSSITLSVNVTKRSNDIARIRFLQGVTLIQDDNPPSTVGSGITTAPYTTPFSDNITFTVEVTDETTAEGGPSTVTATTSYSFIYPYYSGNGAPSRTAAQVALMSKAIINSTANLNRSFTTLNGDVYYFAYPASYGVLTSILDENGFETFSSWTRRTENITGLDATAVSYYIYESNNPVVAGSTNFTFRR